MTKSLYYTAPSDEIFEEVKAKAIELWKEKTASNPEYVDEKTDYIETVRNIDDNIMTIVAMFDHVNMELLAYKLSWEARTAIRERMVDGGNPDGMIPF